MRVTTVSQGSTIKLYLIPENDLDKEALKQVRGGSAEVVTGSVTLDTGPLHDALVISNKISSDEKNNASSGSLDNHIDG